MTLKEAIDKYIEDSDAVLSPTTISGYRTIQKKAFRDIMDVKLAKITNAMLKEAVNKEAKRPSDSRRNKGQPISPKTVSNEYGLITAVLNLYNPGLDCTVKLPAKENKFHELLPPEIIMDLAKGTDIELPVLLAMWLSFTMSEIKGLTKSKSISGKVIYHKFMRMLKKNDLPHMSFHDLRHVNASVMALLHVPDKYAMERGGWKSDKVMKNTYMQTFSQERNEVDQLIDQYFESKMQHDMQHQK